MDSVKEAQQDMRSAYYFGVPGVISSGTAWVVAGAIALFVNPKAGIFTLVFGGMLIFPVSIVLCKLVGRAGKHQKSNPLAPLAIEGTFWMLLSIPVAGAAALYRLDWFFPAMMLVIGGRYLTFATLYGMRVYWAFALGLVLAAFVLIFFNAAVYIGALTGGLVEWLFALVIFVLYKGSDLKSAQA